MKELLFQDSSSALWHLWLILKNFWWLFLDIAKHQRPTSLDLDLRWNDFKSPVGRGFNITIFTISSFMLKSSYIQKANRSGYHKLYKFHLQKEYITTSTLVTFFHSENSQAEIIPSQASVKSTLQDQKVYLDEFFRQCNYGSIKTPVCVWPWVTKDWIRTQNLETSTRMMF